MKFLYLPMVAFIAVSLAVVPAFAQTSNVTATVRPNPLEVEVSAPSPGGVGKWFSIEVTITNKGIAPITKTFAKIHTSSDLKLKTRGKKKRIGTLTTRQIKLIWQAKANEGGNYVVQVEVEGFLEGEKISSGNSALIVATGSVLPSWLRYLFNLQL